MSGVDLGICRSPSNEDFSTSPGSRYNRPNNLGIVPFGGTFAESEVETALEADEALTFDHVEDGGPDASELINDMVLDNISFIIIIPALRSIEIHC